MAYRLREQHVERLRLFLVVRDEVVAGAGALLLNLDALRVDVVLVMAPVTTGLVLLIVPIAASADVHLGEVVLRPFGGEQLADLGRAGKRGGNLLRRLLGRGVRLRQRPDREL